MSSQRSISATSKDVATHMGHGHCRLRVELGACACRKTMTKNI
jgi:hypothetical protein